MDTLVGVVCARSESAGGLGAYDGLPRVSGAGKELMREPRAGDEAGREALPERESWVRRDDGVGGIVNLLRLDSDCKELEASACSATPVLSEDIGVNGGWTCILDNIGGSWIVGSC